MKKVTLPGNSPEGVIPADPGTQILDQNFRVWTKKTGTGNTGWDLEVRFISEESATLSSDNKVFGRGEIIYEEDTSTVKYGDGATPYNSLASSGGGAAGPQGPAGEDGAIGPMGPQGPKGAKGDPGTDGINGAIGPQGPTGPKGDTGDTGPKGDTGDTGPQGPVGPAGADGAQGPSGGDGSAGPEGPVGPQGPQGVQGPPGPAATWGSIGGTISDQVDLQNALDNINALLSSDEVTLDTLQEIVDFIQLNRDDLDALGISSIAGLQAALDGKAATSHTHTESDITDLDKYTQAQVDAFAKGSAKILDLNTTKAEFNANETKVWLTYLVYKEIMTAGVPLEYVQNVVNLSDANCTLDIAGGGSIVVEPYTSKRIQYDGSSLVTTTERIGIGHVSGLQSALDGKEPEVSSTKNVLNLPEVDNLSGATSSDLGGISTTGLLESTVVFLPNIPSLVSVAGGDVVPASMWKLNLSSRPGSESASAIFADDSTTTWWNPVVI